MHRRAVPFLLIATATLLAARTSHAMPPATVTVTAPVATLTVDARFDAASRKLQLGYRLHAIGKEPLAVFDRGDSMDLRTHKLVPGRPAVPLQASEDDGLVFSHRAMPLRKPPPIVPHIPLAARVEPGGDHRGEIIVDVPAETRRARYCLGVAPFPAEGFRPAADAGAGVWLASYRIVDQQTVLCTPWLDLAAQRFAAP